MLKTKARLVFLVMILIASVLIVSTYHEVSANTSDTSESEPITIKEYDSADDLIKRIARETGKPVDEVRRDIEQRQKENQEHGSLSGNRMSWEDFWLYIPNCVGGQKAVVIFDARAGAGTVTFAGMPYHIGAWACPSTSCYFYASTGILLGPPFNYYVSSVSITGDVSIWTAYCTTVT